MPAIHVENNSRKAYSEKSATLGKLHMIILFLRVTEMECCLSEPIRIGLNKEIKYQHDVLIKQEDGKVSLNICEREICRTLIIYNFFSGALCCYSCRNQFEALQCSNTLSHCASLEYRTLIIYCTCCPVVISLAHTAASHVPILHATRPDELNAMLHCRQRLSKIQKASL